MAGFKASERIDRSPEEVFSYASDLGNAASWLPAVTQVDKITEGPLSVGTRFREKRTVGERRGHIEMEVTAYDPPRRYSTAFAQGGYKATYNYTFRAEDSGTRVDLVCMVSGRGLKKLMVPIVAMAMRRWDKKQLASLKEAIEGGA